MGGCVQGMAGVTVSLAQFGACEDKQNNLRRIQDFVQKAKEFGASMLFLPEYSMFYAKMNRQSLNMRAAESLDGPFVSALSQMARQYGLWITAGMYERSDGLPYNAVVVMDKDGTLRGVHRKQRLYDAFGYRESDECRAGESPFCPVDAGWAAGANKVLHWRTLLCARAIENSMAVFGVDQYAPDCFIGYSAAFASDGSTLGALEDGDGLLTITI